MKAIGYKLPSRYVVEIIEKDGSSRFEFLPSQLRVQMRTTELNGENSDLLGSQDLLKRIGTRKVLSVKESGKT